MPSAQQLAPNFGYGSFKVGQAIAMRPSRFLKAAARRHAWPLIGALIALGVPIGLLALRCILARRAPTPSFLASVIAADPAGFVYVTVAPLVMLALLGRTLGSRDDALSETSITDPLTRLYNRRHIDARLAQELGRATRHGSPLALMLLDVDHLKEINDYAGHDAGDATLIAVAETLRGTCRATDLAARYGGDEFMVLLPETTASQARELAERIRASLRERTKGRESESAVTVSIGITDLARAKAARPDAMFEAADAALYVAKEGGRNRVELAAAPALVAGPGG